MELILIILHLAIAWLLPFSLVLDRVRPIPCWRPIPDTIGRSCTDTDIGNDVPHSFEQTHVSYVAHTVRTFQNIMPLTLCFEMYETNYSLETTGTHATVLTVETGKWTTGIGANTKMSIDRYQYPPMLASIGRYPLPNTGIGLTLVLDSHYLVVILSLSIYLSTLWSVKNTPKCFLIYSLQT